MYRDDNPDGDLTTEHLLEAVLVAAVRELDLDDVCTGIALPVPADDTDTAVQITAAHSFPEVGMLTLNRGVYIELSDGSTYTLTIGVYRRPTTETHLQPRLSTRRDLRRHQ